MAAFSYYPHAPFLLDSIFLSNVPAFSQEPNTTSSESLPVTPVYESSCLENCTKVSNVQPSLTSKHTEDSSSVVDEPQFGEQVTQKVNSSMHKKRKIRDGSSSSSMSSVLSVEAREVKVKRQKRRNGGKKDEREEKAEGATDKKVHEDIPKGYIHVRARRGQATDSHSLAERVRREKISERMKLLQALVPGCDKATGKALVLDEIINYVQSLQNQVEFLSMKLASMDSVFYDFGVDLDAFIVTQGLRLTSLGSTVLPDVQQISTAFCDTTITTMNAPPSSLLLDHEQLHSPNTLPGEETGQLLWEVDDQRQILIDQSGFFSHNLGSFPLV